jgi:hypothetical protein
MTLKRTIALAVAGLSLAVGVAYAGWFYQNGRWYYTPDIGTESIYKGVPNPETQPSYVQWTLTTVRYGCACRNNGGNFASEVVSVEPVTLTALDMINGSDFLDKKRGIAMAAGHIDTEGLCSPERVTCQNPNWYVDPEYDLVYAFTGTTEAFLYNKKTLQYEAVAGSRQEVTCELSDYTASPLNLPAPGTPYNCF